MSVINEFNCAQGEHEWKHSDRMWGPERWHECRWCGVPIGGETGDRSEETL